MANLADGATWTKPNLRVLIAMSVGFVYRCLPFDPVCNYVR